MIKKHPGWNGMKMEKRNVNIST
ncbi:uncharacterized protein METZ01_LOCUS76342, partial [marine metagenome]